MCNITCKTAINKKENTITISVLEDNIVLNYENDIDFTGLISKLTEMVEEDKKIELECSETEDEKEKLILDTLKDIFNEYNNCLTIEQNTENLPF
ncbi:hypothetical protein HOC37_02675 [bacterium]|jgi:hypothetical protein|nr:hypothetical protein [bacterium]